MHAPKPRRAHVRIVITSGPFDCELHRSLTVRRSGALVYARGSRPCSLRRSNGKRSFLQLMADKRSDSKIRRQVIATIGRFDKLPA